MEKEKQRANRRKIIKLRLKEKHTKFPPISASPSPNRTSTKIPLYKRLEDEYKKKFELPDILEKEAALKEIKKNRSIPMNRNGKTG